jgi:hypothetical protein
MWRVTDDQHQLLVSCIRPIDSSSSSSSSLATHTHRQTLTTEPPQCLITSVLNACILFEIDWPVMLACDPKKKKREERREKGVGEGRGAFVGISERLHAPISRCQMTLHYCSDGTIWCEGSSCARACPDTCRYGPLRARKIWRFRSEKQRKETRSTWKIWET